MNWMSIPLCDRALSVLCRCFVLLQICHIGEIIIIFPTKHFIITFEKHIWLWVNNNMWLRIKWPWDVLEVTLWWPWMTLSWHIVVLSKKKHVCITECVFQCNAYKNDDKRRKTRTRICGMRALLACYHGNKCKICLNLTWDGSF